MIDKKTELLAPAGDLEKLKIAVLYGADAVYIGGEEYSLRAKAKNFTEEQMKEGIEFAHSHGAKVYVTANIYAHLDYSSKLSSAQAMVIGMPLPEAGDFGSRWEQNAEKSGE